MFRTSVPSKSQSPRAAYLLILLIALGCRGGMTATAPEPRRSSQERLANLHAFARLYGVVRWFHPSDATAAADWDRFAIDGVRRVIQVSDAHGLRAALTELFAPIAPTVQIAAVTEQFRVEPAVRPPEANGLEQVAWEHK